MANILVTGGAGFIGSHTCKALAKKGHTPIGFDNLSRGHKEAVKWGPLIEGDIRNINHLKEIMKKHDISAVIHFAAFAYIKESVEHPQMYFENNVTGTALLLQAMLEAEVKTIVFSSSCATYGESTAEQISEDHPQNPINPYGLSKLMGERMLEQYKRQHQFKICGLRYFNAAGADPDGELGENHDPEPHLIPTLIRQAATNTPITLNGQDYPTPDGTCIRDFIHVTDLAEAHVVALEGLLENSSSHDFYNLGVGNGYSLLEVAKSIKNNLNSTSPIKYSERRSGDPAKLICDNSRFQKQWNWSPKHNDLNFMIESAKTWLLKQD